MLQQSLVPFSEYPDIEILLAETVVGNFKHKESLLVLRACCRSLRNAVDSSIATWCSRFSTQQRGRMSKQDQDEMYSSIVNAELMVDRAFGSYQRPAKLLLDVSVVNKTTYLCALVNRCVLCGDTMIRDCRVAMEDSEECIVPNYAYAHRSCIRKNLVMLIDTTSIQRGAEPRELHRELSAVAQLNPRNVVINRKTVMESISTWYKTAYANKRAFGPQLVWLRNHPLVRPEDTLYGSMKITNDEVNQSLVAASAHSRDVSVQAEVRRRSVVSRIELHKQQCLSEFRLWLGKGHTRWRTVEDLEELDDNIMSSIGFLGHTNTPHLTRVVCGSMTVVFNAVALLHRTIDMLNERARYCMDWLVNTIGVYAAFENNTTSFSPVAMSLLPSEVKQSASEHEVTIVSAILNAFASCKPSDVTVVRFTKSDASRPTNELPKYNAHVSVFIREFSVNFTSRLVIAHSDLCKLKFVLLRLVDPYLGKTIPPAPTIPDSDVSSVENFFTRMIKCCFAEGSGVALSKGLSMLVNYASFVEIRDSLQEPEDF